MRLSGTSAYPFEYEAVQGKIDAAKKTAVHPYQWLLYRLALIVFDFLMVGAALRIAYFIRFESGIPIFRLEVVPSLDFYLTLVYIFIPAWLLVFALFGLYKRENLLGGTTEYSRVFYATFTAMTLVIFAGFLGPEIVIARGWLLISWAFSFLLVASARFLLRSGVRRLRTHGYFLSPALIIGANEEARLLAEQFGDWAFSGLNVLGLVNPGAESHEQPIKGLPVVGGLEGLDEQIQRLGVEELVIASSALTRDQLLDIFRKYGMQDHLHLRMSSGLYEIITTGLEVKEVAGVPLVKVNKSRLTGMDQVLKTILDLGIGIPVMIVALPVMGLLALAIKLDSRGPVIHRRRVMGVNGKQFDAFKFRTMHVNGDAILAQHPELQEELARNHKLKDDPRVTRVGKFVRKLSLDELPQIFNVLRREMSLVGPRMISPPEMAEYDKWGINLLTIRPGITGLWQVSGRSDVTYEERVRLDMFYIRNWTVWFDLYLIVRTIPAVLERRGAY